MSLHQRARGHLVVDIKQRDGISTLADLRQEGCLKARFPRPVDWLEVITLNSSGGIAGGDRVASNLRVQSGARATFAGQAAERYYRALPTDAPAHIRTSLRIEPNAAAEWLPQDSILFDRCAIDRVLDVEVAVGAWFLGLETLIFGRAALGETIATARIADTVRIRQNGRLRLQETIRIDGEVASTLARPATAAGATAIATIVMVGEPAPPLDRLREILKPYEAGATAWNDTLIARIVAKDSANLRAAILPSLDLLRAGRALPRVWIC